MSIQLQSKVLMVVLEKIEHLTVIKNDPPESEIVKIGIDDILDSSEEESIEDIKDIQIVSHELSEDLIKSEPVSENILENNNLFIETENITQSENLNKTENTSDGNVNRGTVQGLIEVQGINNILDSSDEESIQDIKDIEIVLHELSEDLIKSETVSENILGNNHPGSIETQIFVQTENDPFIETEIITQSENLNKTENTSDGNVNRGTAQGLIEVQGIDNILDSSDEESIQDIKDIEIVLHELSEDLIKSETVSENILENNNLFIETENITQSENLNKTENTSDGNVNRGTAQGLIEVQGIDNILDSSDEESIQDIKDIEIVLHELSEDLIKSETVSENILENNNLFIETENITQSENLNKTENTSDGNVNRGTAQGLIEVQGIDDILDSSDEDRIPDIKDIEIVLHELSEDLIKSGTVSKNILENNNLYIETENITQSENLNKTENTSDGNVNRGTAQGLIEVQGIDDILDSSDEESIQDIKDIEIVLHELSEDLIKSETVSENILGNNHPGSIETQIFVQTENDPFIKTENITQSENLNKTENTSDGNVNRGTAQGLIEVQGIDDILDSSDEESIPIIKDIKIVLHKLSEDLIKSKTVSENILENNHPGSIETQFFVQTENDPFIKTENITQSENLNKTENTSDGNVNRGTAQGLIEVQGIDDILDSSDEESIPIIKDIKIVLHKLSEDLIKSKTVSENILENNHPGSIETQIFVQTENDSFIETENITQSENLNKTENASDGNVNRGTGEGLIEVQGSNEHFNAFANQTDKQHVLNFSKNLSNISLRSRKVKRSGKRDFSECDTLVETTSYKKLKKDKEKRKVIEVPMLRVEPHESITLAKDKDVCNNNKSTHKKHKARYCCKKCTYTSEISSRFKVHQLTRKTKAEIYDRLLKYRCDKCQYKTFRHQCFKRHKLIHLKPEVIQYFYCYHCSYKCKPKSDLKKHIFRHFKNEDVQFHCYICDFVTLKRVLIIEHFKTHPKHHSKFDETEYKYQLEICSKRYCCEKCTYTSGISSDFKLHQLTHKTKAEIDDRLLKYRCDKCKYKTFRQQNFQRHKLIHLKPEEIQYFYCYHCSYTCKVKSDLKKHIFRHFKNEDVQFHCYICDFVTLKRVLIIEHFKTHPKHHSKCDETEYKYQLEICNKRYCCEKCTYTSGISSDFKLHQLTHKTKAEIDDRLLKYRCDKCKYKTFRHQNFKRHKLIHLKPEEIQYFYCYHCSYKCKLKSDLKKHIFRHFKNKDVQFHCYICDFVTLKRELIIEHFKTHPKHNSKCGETEYKYQLEICNKSGTN